MEDGAHRKRINCLISARRGTGLLLADRLLRGKERGGGGEQEDGNRKGKRVKREQATDESPSVFRGERGQKRENKPNNRRGAALGSYLLWAYLSKATLKCIFDISRVRRGTASAHVRNNELGRVASISRFRDGERLGSCSGGHEAAPRVVSDRDKKAASGSDT